MSKSTQNRDAFVNQGIAYIVNKTLWEEWEWRKEKEIIAKEANMKIYTEKENDVNQNEVSNRGKVPERSIMVFVRWVRFENEVKENDDKEE